MSEKLEDYLASSGYQNEVFFGYFHVKNNLNCPKNGHGKSRLPYRIKHLHQGSNPHVTLARLEVLEFQDNQLYRLKTIEDFLSNHLKDPVFEAPKQKSLEPLSIDSIGIQFEVEFELLEQTLKKSRHH